jgi:hypothetical protein
MSNYPTKIQEIIQKRGIRKLIHFTKLKNLESIYKYGILSRDQIEKEEIQVEFNDSWRRDAWLKTSSFSVTKKNSYLFNVFVERYKTQESDWFEILISPSILTERKCIFCDHNAASRQFDIFRENPKTLSGPEVFESMFNDKVFRTNGCDVRTNLSDDLTTSNQAEICIYGEIKKEYFLNLREIEKKVKSNG